MIVTHARPHAGPYVVAPEASSMARCCMSVRALGLDARCASARPSCWGAAADAGLSRRRRREVRISVLNDAGERRRQPVQIDGDDALTLPVSIGLSPEAVRLLKPA